MVAASADGFDVVHGLPEGSAVIVCVSLPRVTNPPRTTAMLLADDNRGMATWLFQCNPAKFRIFDAVADGRPIRNWAAKQNRTQMRPGDDAVLWVGGADGRYPAGVYAIGRIRSLEFAGRVDSRYWSRGATPEPRHFIDIKFREFFFHNPIPGRVLANDPDFATAKILERVHRFTDCLLTPTEFSAIVRRVPKYGPTTFATLTT